MTSRAVVFIDPDGTGREWMYVIVFRETGIWYEHQYGGTANRQGRVQGFLVPVHSVEARRAFDELFIRDLKGTGLWGGQRRASSDIVDRVSQSIAMIRYWESIPDALEPHSLVLDTARLRDIDEGWLPVLTPDGPGVLIWPNSD